MRIGETLARARREAGSRIVNGFFEGASRVGRLHPRSRPERHRVEVIREIGYLPGSPRIEHRLDIYRPLDAPDPIPTVLYIHGGGFRILSKDTHWIMGLAFARRGYLVFNVSYRLAPEHRFPAAVEDVARAFTWLTERGPDYGADLDRLVIAGESAGANLAATLAMCTSYRREEPYARAVFDTGVTPKAVLPACGIFQVTDVARFARRKAHLSRFVFERLEEVEHGYLGRDAARHGGTLDLADPLSWAERGDAPDRPLPPFFLPVGTKDPLLPDTRRLGRALRELGAEAEEAYYEGEVHAFHAFPFLKNARRCWRDSYGFLDAHCPADR